MRRYAYALVALLAAALCGCGKHAVPRADSAANDDENYVVLVSLDGFRHDYARHYRAGNILALARDGVTSDGLIPPFPSRTFPSHYTIATGLAPVNHGLVANRFYDPGRKAHYSLRDRNAVGDGSWYGGTPLWVLAERQGLRSATYFWVGSEADVQGIRPSNYFDFDRSVPYEKRVAQVGRWLGRPHASRPRLVMLYFSLVDSAGHYYGLGSPELAAAVAQVDKTIGQLSKKLAASGLPVNLIVVSDHGMSRVDNKNVVNLTQLADLDGFETVDEGPLQMFYHADPQRVREAYEALANSGGPFRVYLRHEVPAYLNFRDNRRIGDIVVISDPPVILTSEKDKRIHPATHGFDPHRHREMHGIFYAAGPAFRSGVRMGRAHAVDVYPLVAHLLGLEHPPVDGKLDAFSEALR